MHAFIVFMLLSLGKHFIIIEHSKWNGPTCTCISLGCGQPTPTQILFSDVADKWLACGYKTFCSKQKSNTKLHSSTEWNKQHSWVALVMLRIVLLIDLEFHKMHDCSWPASICLSWSSRNHSPLVCGMFSSPSLCEVVCVCRTGSTFSIQKASVISFG